MNETHGRLGATRRWGVVALVIGLAAAWGMSTPAGAQAAPKLEISPTSSPEVDSLTITVSGTGCHEDGFTASVVAVFWGGPPGGTRFGSRSAPIVPDEAGNWSGQILVASPLPPLTAEVSHAVGATCTLTSGEDVHSFDYEEVPFVITAAPAETTTTAPPPVTTVPPSESDGPTPELAPAATPVVAEPSFTG